MGNQSSIFRWALVASSLTLLVFTLNVWFSVPLFAKTVTLTLSDNRTSICLIEGDTLAITLPSPMRNSFKWEVASADPPGLPQIDQNVAQRSADSQTLKFNAALVGKTSLTLNFKRQKPGAAPEVTQTFRVDVSVSSGEPAAATLIDTYKGTMPCADCSGVQTVLRLYAKGKFDFTDTVYIDTRTYLGAHGGDLSYTDRGEWSVLKGDAVDANATVYALNPDQPEQEQFLLLQAGGAALTQLDWQMKPVDAPSGMDLTLKRVR